MAKGSDIEFTGKDAFHKARHMARYGHKDWLYWTDGQTGYAARRTAKNIKRMLLVTGTKGEWALITANDGCPMHGFWAMGLNMLRQAKYGI